MPQIRENWGQLVGNHLILEQWDYEIQKMADDANDAARCMASLNPDQSAAFEKITSAVSNKSGDIIFLHGPGGTGKTYLITPSAITFVPSHPMHNCSLYYIL
jgi:DNA replication protein DnaC